MVKKIKDLTEEEVKKICDNRDSCKNCPLVLYSPSVLNGFVCLTDHNVIETLNEEIEVEDNEQIHNN